MVSSTADAVVLIRTAMLASTPKSPTVAWTAPEKLPAIPAVVSTRAPWPFLTLTAEVPPVGVRLTVMLESAMRVTFT